MADDPDAGFLLVPVRAQPRARRAAIGGVVVGADGRLRLRIAVTEPPEDGRASKAVCAALARALDVPASRVTLQSGAAAREKLLRVQGDRALLSERLHTLMQRQAGSGTGGGVTR